MLGAEGWVVAVCQRKMLPCRLGFLEVPNLKLKQPDPGGVPQGDGGGFWWGRGTDKGFENQTKIPKVLQLY